MERSVNTDALATIVQRGIVDPLIARFAQCAETLIASALASNNGEESE